MIDRTHITLSVPPEVDMARVVGEADSVLRVVQERIDARITVRGNDVMIDGSQAEAQVATNVFSRLVAAAEDDEPLGIADAKRLIDLARSPDLAPHDLRDDVLLSRRGRAVRPRTPGQKRYVDAIRSHTVTFGVGPAGTGKTYLAVALAVAALDRREISRVILSRPVVEAGESLGFLPGTLTEKIDPYIRPLYDALYDMLDADRARRLLEGNVIEIAPLAFMRGRTFNDSFVILDEAQNATPEQMKMFLTRLGFGSKMVVTGDVTQVDLPHGRSGLAHARDVLEGLDDVAFCDFDGKDVVRHSLVASIVSAYEQRAGKGQRREDRLAAPGKGA